MKYLLDTHILLWAAADNLPKAAKKYFSEENELYFSPASIWEIVIKRALFRNCRNDGNDRNDFQIDPGAFYAGLLAAGYKELPITARHTLTVESLPKIHKDPFDRILLSQAKYERMHFVTADKDIAKYPFRIVLIGNRKNLLKP